jgi:hypothetical protein
LSHKAVDRTMRCFTGKLTDHKGVLQLPLLRVADQGTSMQIAKFTPDTSK